MSDTPAFISAAAPGAQGLSEPGLSRSGGFR
jgi:hypothetical protein